MELRFQHLFLIVSAFLVGLTGSAWADSKKLPLDNEYFELGITTGVVAIQDFNSEYTLGVGATFAASESFFLQFNYMTANSSLSAFEESQGRYFDGSDRTFTHYDLLVGYSIFHGELFVREGDSTLSNLYVVGGVGNNSFGGEDNFATTVGLGYKLGLSRKYNLSFDFRDYIYKSSLIVEDKTVHNTHFSIGLSYQL